MEKKDWIFDRSFRIGEIRKKNFLKKLRKKREFVLYDKKDLRGSSITMQGGSGCGS
jgi:hypothetical protein